MKKLLTALLICPACLPREYSLELVDVRQEADDDIVAGTLICPRCGRRFPVEDGVAFLDLDRRRDRTGKYEQDEVLSSYLWSHYGDLLGDEQATDAYRRWAGLMEPHSGLALDLGGAVGRFAFEMSGKCDFVVGLDKSRAFIRAARQLMLRGELSFTLKEEGLLGREAVIRCPGSWRRQQVEFIVADAQRLPFATHAATSLASLNLVDKVPEPIIHIAEMDRVAGRTGSQLLLSDPFSWSIEAAEMDQWLGGRADGPFPGKGLENIKAILGESRAENFPGWQITNQDHVWWKIRSHSNHYELIRSCYIKAER